MFLQDAITYARSDNYMSAVDTFYASRGDHFHCIMDRTQEDVDRVKYLREVLLSKTNTPEELEEYKGSLKGALNYSDLERIEYNLQLLDSILDLNLVSMDRDVIPRVPYFVNLLINVKKVWDTKYRRYTTPDVPEMPLSWYWQWNDIETILWDCFKVYTINNSTDAKVFCGESMYADANCLI